MSRLATLLALSAPVLALAAPAPRMERATPALTAESVGKLEPVAEIPIDGWRLVWGPNPGELSILEWLGHVHVLDGKTYKPLRTIAEGRKLTHVAFARGGEIAAWSDNDATRVEITNLSTGKGRTVEAGGRQAGVTFSPDGKFLATGVYGQRATLWKVDTAEKVRELETDADGGLRVVFTKDGTKLALSNRNSVTSIYEAASGKLLHTLPKKMTQEVRFNPAGTVLAAGYVDGMVGLWDVATGNLLHLKTSGTKELYSVDWSPRGDLLATSGLGGKIVVWDAKGLKGLKELDAPEWVIQVRFSPDGSRLLTSGGSAVRGPERKVTVWGVRDGSGRP